MELAGAGSLGPLLGAGFEQLRSSAAELRWAWLAERVRLTAWEEWSLARGGAPRWWGCLGGTGFQYLKQVIVQSSEQFRFLIA